MNEKNCCLIRDLLPLYIDNVVSEETKNFIEDHLCHCEECKKEFDLLTQDTVISDNVSARLDEAKPWQALKRRMRRKTVLIAAALLFMFAITVTALSTPAIINRGNPIPYISAAASLSKQSPFVLVNVKHGHYNIYMTKGSNCKELIQYIEEIWDMKLAEQTKDGYFFSNEEGAMLYVPYERYWGSYTIWEVLDAKEFKEE